MNGTSFDRPLFESDGQAAVLPEARARVAAAIRAYVNDRITAFEFDEFLDEFRDSPDPIVRFVVSAVWFHYDDCIDHFVVMTKAQWDYFQRLLLLLESHCRLQTQTVRKWSWTQLVAGICLAAIVSIAFKLGWKHLLFFSIPFGTVSIILAKFRRPLANVSNPLAHLVHPFASFQDLQFAYESVQFAKARYRREIGDRRIRSVAIDSIYHFTSHRIWLLLAPVILLFQLRPITTTNTSAVFVRH